LLDHVVHFKRDEMKRAKQKPEAPLCWSIKRTAEALGMDLNAIYRAAHRGDLPCVRVGRRVLIPVEALRRKLASAGME